MDEGARLESASSRKGRVGSNPTLSASSCTRAQERRGAAQSDCRAAAVLWTGGKDCALAMHEACASGNGIEALVTFVPPGAGFLAHPLHVIRLQAEALCIPHHCIEVAEPYDEGYRRAIEHLRGALGICTLITGDIGRVGGHENWVRQCAEPLGVEVRTPLWDIAPEAALTRMVEAGFDAVISCVRTDVLGVDWLGTHLTWAALERLMRDCRQTGIDVCGEQGEYHTLVMDGPGFGHRVTPGLWRVAHRDGLAYLQWAEANRWSRRYPTSDAEK